MQRNAKNIAMIPAIVVSVIALITFSFAAVHVPPGNAVSGMQEKINKSVTQVKGPYIILKFDDLSDIETPWSGFKAVTDICKAKGVKCTLGMFGQTLERHDTDYLNYVKSLINDPDVEIWMHGYNGAPDELLGNPAYQAWAFAKTRWNLLYYYDYLLRTFSPHWKSGDAFTEQVFLEDPFYLTWPLNPPGGNFKGLLDNRCQLEYGDTHYPDSLSILKKNYDSCASGMSYFIYQGHPWAWDAAARKIFGEFIDYMKSKGARFTTSYEYYEIIHNIHDTTSPSVPGGIKLTRKSPRSIGLTWNQSTDSESTVDGYKIYRNGVFIDIVPGTSYTNTAEENLSDTTKYQISAVNRANLVSARSPNISITPAPAGK